jgi:hypothetical protein
VGLSPEPPESPGLVKAASSRRTPNFRRQIETTVCLSPESPGVPRSPPEFFVMWPAFYAFGCD